MDRWPVSATIHQKRMTRRDKHRHGPNLKPSALERHVSFKNLYKKMKKHIAIQIEIQEKYLFFAATVRLLNKSNKAQTRFLKTKEQKWQLARFSFVFISVKTKVGAVVWDHTEDFRVRRKKKWEIYRTVNEEYKWAEKERGYEPVEGPFPKIDPPIRSGQPPPSRRRVRPSVDIWDGDRRHTTHSHTHTGLLTRGQDTAYQLDAYAEDMAIDLWQDKIDTIHPTRPSP